MDFGEWVRKYRKRDYKLLLKLAKKKCYPFVHDVLDMYYCLSEIYREYPNIKIPLIWDLADMIYNEIQREITEKRDRE